MRACPSRSNLHRNSRGLGGRRPWTRRTACWAGSTRRTWSVKRRNVASRLSQADDPFFPTSVRCGRGAVSSFSE